MTRRSRSSGHWRRQERADPFVERAHREGWRSRAVFKLQQIDAQERLLRRGLTCVDLGAAPGGWSQYAARAVGPTGRVVALDLLEMEPLEGVEILRGDFGEAAVLEQAIRALGGRPADVVMSDMAPNISGMRAVDQPRAMQLADDALAGCASLLRPGGDFVAKLFQGEGFDDYVATARAGFGKVKLKKPKASRPESREIYLLARGYRL